MIQADETFDGTWNFTPRFCSAAGFQQHYVDEGAGRPVVLLHGQPTWGYIYRRFIVPLSAAHRVIVPDHMSIVGFDDLPIAQYITPQLTTIKVPAREMGFSATMRLIAAIETDGRVSALELPTQLAIRGSTAPRRREARLRTLGKLATR